MLGNVKRSGAIFYKSWVGIYFMDKYLFKHFKEILCPMVSKILWYWCLTGLHCWYLYLFAAAQWWYLRGLVLHLFKQFCNCSFQWVMSECNITTKLTSKTMIYSTWCTTYTHPWHEKQLKCNQSVTLLFPPSEFQKGLTHNFLI